MKHGMTQSALCRSGEQRWKWFVALFMAVGLAAISFSVAGRLPELSFPTALLLGLTWLTSGNAALHLYIRRTQQAAREAE